MKTTIILIALTAGLIFTAQSQTKKEVEDGLNALQRAFNDYDAKHQAEFNTYVNKVDSEFTSYLRKNWLEYRLSKGVSPDTTPKPKYIPQFDPGIQKTQPGKKNNEIIINPNEIFLRERVEKIPQAPLILKEEEVENQAPNKQMLKFYGVDVEVNFDKELNGSLPADIHNTTIADCWDRLSKTNYSGLIKTLFNISSKMNLNDWGYFMLVRKTAERISSDSNYSRTLTWFLMNKSGFKFKIAYSSDHVWLCFPSTTNIYGIKYFTISNVKYYTPEYCGNILFTYEQDFSVATKVIDMNIYNALNIGDNYDKKNFSYSYKETKYSFSIDYNRNSIEFYKDFPLCDIRTYFNAVTSSRAKESILNALKPVIEKMSESDAVDFLLNFVQNEFLYKDDLDNFNGKEKYNFPEETFFYQYSDCDDRAVLFSFLVKELIPLKVIGIEYPGHLSTAVHFSNDEPGDFISYKGEKYLIADPTFTNAPFGVTMPAYRHSEAKIIEINNSRNEGQGISTIWDKIQSGGGLRGDNKQNYGIDKNGNYYLTGYFDSIAEFGGTTLATNSYHRDAFLVKYNIHGHPEWAIQGFCEGNAVGKNIVLDNAGEIYLCGTFEKTISFGGIMLFANNESNKFVVKIDQNGKMIWLNQIPNDSKTVEPGIYVSSFLKNGAFIKTVQFPYDINFDDYGMIVDNDGNLSYTYSNIEAIGKREEVSLSANAEYNVIEMLKAENDKLLKDNCERTIAGIFGVLAIMKTSNVVVSGKTIQEAIDRYNPTFKNAAPGVFQNLGKIKMMKNDQGIIVLLTVDSKPIAIDKLKISNDTHLKAVTLPNGDIRIDVFDGVKVGKAFLWFNLNYIKLFKLTGNVLFDYDTDHSQALVNLKRDLFY